MSNLQRWNVYARAYDNEGINKLLFGFFVDTSIHDNASMKSMVYKKVVKDYGLNQTYHLIISEVESIEMKDTY